MAVPITIRNAEPRDTEAIVRHNAALAMESEDKHLDHAVLARGVHKLLADPSRGRYLIAEVDGQTAGQLMLTYEWSDWRDGWFWWIQSVYVHPEHRRIGVFRALYEHVTAQARSTPDVCGLRLYVEQGNDPARQTYHRLGMDETGYRLMQAMLTGPDAT